jgi:hypothetical protein
MMPLLYASRSPRVYSALGRKPCRARIELSTGKPLNAVLAARNKMIIVMAMTNTKPTGNPSKTVAANCAMIVSWWSVTRTPPWVKKTPECSSTILAPVRLASAMMPPSIEIATTPSRRAWWRRCGSSAP